MATRQARHKAIIHHAPRDIYCTPTALHERLLCEERPLLSGCVFCDSVKKEERKKVQGFEAQHSHSESFFPAQLPPLSRSTYRVYYRHYRCLPDTGTLYSTLRYMLVSSSIPAQFRASRFRRQYKYRRVALSNRHQKGVTYCCTVRTETGSMTRRASSLVLAWSSSSLAARSLPDGGGSSVRASSRQ